MPGFYMGLGIQTQVLMLVWQALAWLSLSPGPVSASTETLHWFSFARVTCEVSCLPPMLK